MSTHRPRRRRLSELVLAKLAAHGIRSVHALATDDETGRALRDEIADDVQHIAEHADPRGPSPRLAYRWAWTDGKRDRETARSLVVAVDVLSRDGADRFELGCWRVRELCTVDGRPVDTLDTLRHLQRELGIVDLPDDITGLIPDLPPAYEPSDRTTLALMIAALTSTEDGARACCRGRGDRELSAAHEEAHRLAATAAALDPEAVARYRALLVAQLRALPR
ncbi:hypothetical protein [Pseudonocardia sp. MH-G8]|uniref:hypothetical protein n=1 Tax=Pseudonocardia sp. MH-G8 TaxID=1854588 RepID=UPI000BA0C19A|nr:hypothetical protein [Pseudonocardia sp. MH-G8]OZM84096.1 hypothetical protein CFP66_06725 [Pseudonocardia sp. MH-G8]